LTVEGLNDGYDVVLGTNFGIVEWGDGFIGLIGSASMVDGKVEKETPDDHMERKGIVQWVALQDKYFLSVLMPQEASAALAKKEGEKLVSAGARMPSVNTTTTLQLYAGPKEYDTLRSFNVGLEETIDFGWFIFGSWSVVKAVAKPIFYVLRFLNEYTHNYGVTIILLTMGIKLLFVPLQYKSYKSMKQMQMIQPKVLGLQEKYKDDRDKLNKELIKLYRDHRFVRAGSLLRTADHHGRDDGHSAKDHANHYGSDSGQNYVGLTGIHDLSLRQFSCGTRALLAYQQCADDRAASADRAALRQ
jgi:YidC/Oxa1 family membrane protein insertase